MYSVLKNMYASGDLAASDSKFDMVSNSITSPRALSTTFSPRFELSKYEHQFSSCGSLTTNTNPSVGRRKAKKDR
jgi:hypothetical protein